MKTFHKSIMTVTLFFALIQCNGQNTVKIKKDKIGGLFELSETGKIYKSYNEVQSYRLDTISCISFQDFESAKKEKASYNKNLYVLEFKLNQSGKIKFEEMTKRNVGKQICFVIKDKVIIAPLLNSAITDGKISLSGAQKNIIEEIIEYLKN